MRYAAWVLIIAGFGVLAWIVLERPRPPDAQERIAALEVERDSAFAAAWDAAEKAAAMTAEVARLEEIRAAERRLAEARARNLTRRADSLSAAIQGLVPAGEAREQAAALLAQMRASYEERISDLQGLVGLGDRTILALRDQIASLETETVSLRRALEVTTEQRDLCMDAKGPGLWQRVRESAGPIGVALGVGLIAGLLAG